MTVSELIEQLEKMYGKAPVTTAEPDGQRTHDLVKVVEEYGEVVLVWKR